MTAIAMRHKVILSRLRNTLLGARRAARPQVEGCIHRRSIHHASGWARDRADAAAKLGVEAVIMTPDGELVVGRTIADAYYGFLSVRSFDDVWHGFQVIYDQPLADGALDSLIIRAAGIPLEFGSLPELPVDPVLPGQYLVEGASPLFLGYIDAISSDNVSGWLLDVNNPGARIAFEIVAPEGGGTSVIAVGIADQFYPPLQSGRFGDAKHGFDLHLTGKLTGEKRDGLIVRPTGHLFSLPRGPAFQGYVDEVTTTHVMGWVQDRFRPEHKLPVQAFVGTADGERDLGGGTADRFHAGLAFGAPHNAEHGFVVHFSPELPPEQLGLVQVRLTGSDYTLAVAPAMAEMPSSVEGRMETNRAAIAFDR